MEETLSNMDQNRGSNKGILCSTFIEDEAECSDKENSWENIFDEETDSDIEGLINNNIVSQGNSLELFAQQQAQDSAAEVLAVKRKLTQTARRCPLGEIDYNILSKKPRLEDSGYAEASAPSLEVDIVGSGGDSAPTPNYLNEILQAKDSHVAKLTFFKKAYGLGFGELTRPFKSDKTCCPTWVACVFGLSEEILESSKIQLQQYCDYIQLNPNMCNRSFCGLYLLEFKTGKSRETVKRLLCTLLAVHEQQILSNPPKNRSTPAALYWYKTKSTQGTFTYGELPVWICQQTMISHQCNEVQFELSRMVQWAYDNEWLDEAKIAYYYARLADTDENAAAWLRSNNQARYVKECSQMVRYYKKAERAEMSFSQWLTKCIQIVSGEGNWRVICQFLRFQNINFVAFMIALKDFLHSKPKKNCMVLYGPPNSGKSMFAMSLLKFLRGKVISFVNSRSHFWLSPLTDCKFAVLDDATHPCWAYIDVYLRNALDGNPFCIDTKHKQPVQVTFPPVLVTTNINVFEENKYFYLHSRLQGFCFPNEFPFTDDGHPAFQLTDQNWKAFFTKLRDQLELPDVEDDCEDGDSCRPFRCVAEQASGHI